MVYANLYKDLDSGNCCLGSPYNSFRHAMTGSFTSKMTLHMGILAFKNIEEYITQDERQSDRKSGDKHVI